MWASSTPILVRGQHIEERFSLELTSMHRVFKKHLHDWILRLVRDAAEFQEIHSASPFTTIPGFSPWRHLDKN